MISLSISLSPKGVAFFDLENHIMLTKDVYHIQAENRKNYLMRVEICSSLENLSLDTNNSMFYSYTSNALPH